MSRATVAVALLSAGLVGSPAAAQDWRTVSSRRQVAGEEHLRVKVEFGAGEFHVEPAETGTLYRTSIRYDARTFRPVNEYDPGRLLVGIDGNGRHIRTNIGEGGRLDLGLGPDVPVDLDLEFGAAEAELELGGLRISGLRVATGASETRLRFSQPNSQRMDLLRIEAGAAAIRAEGLGNANVERIDVDGGVGDITLDFTGAWRGDVRVQIGMGLGSLNLRLPRGVGVRVNKDTFLMSFDSQGLIKRGGSFYSPDWDEAAHKLTIDIDGAIGSIDVRWVDPNDIL